MGELLNNLEVSKLNIISWNFPVKTPFELNRKAGPAASRATETGCLLAALLSASSLFGGTSSLP